MTVASPSTSGAQAGAAARDPGRPARWALVLLLALGLVLQLPSLGVGFFADDYVHQLILTEPEELMPTSRWNLYDFASAAEWSEFERNRGALPWWTPGDWKVRFFRPLASLSIVLDHALWGERALGYHATNLLLWLVLLVVVHRLYLAVGLTGRTALLGLLVLTLSDASSVPVGWISNRNSLLEGLCAAGAVLTAVRGKVPVALALGVAAALCKESGACALLLVAAILWGRGRSRPALVAALLFAAHLAFLALAGYGTRSVFYATPWADPLRFLDNTLTLASAGLLSFLGPLPLDLVVLFPGAQLGLVVLGFLLGWPLASWIVRSAKPGLARPLFALWTALFLLPQGGVVPSDRLLLVPSIGAAGLLAAAWTGVRARWPELARPRRVVAVALALSVTLGSGLYLLMQNAGVLPGMANHLRAKALATDVGPRDLGRRNVLVLQSESQMQAFTLGATWHVESDDRDVLFHTLQSGPRPVRWTRSGERTFELETLGRPFLDGPFERVYLSEEAPPAPGTRFVTPLFTVEPLLVDETGLRKFRVTLERSLDDPGIRFVRPVEGVLTRIAPPDVGATIELAEAVPSRPFVP